jgi:cell division protein ZapB
MLALSSLPHEQAFTSVYDDECGLTLPVSEPHNPRDFASPSTAAVFRLFSIFFGASLMTQATTATGTDQELQLFETRIEELVTLTMQLREENRALRQRLDGLMSERATLLQKNEQVRARVEAMIGRLKAMEHGA